jgi:hypothetical protein
MFLLQALPPDALSLGRDALIILLVLDKAAALVKAARQKNGGNGHNATAGEQTRGFWESFIAEAALKGSERATSTLVMPILKAMQVSINQTQEAISRIADTQEDVAQTLAILKDRDDQKTVTEAATAAAAAASAAAIAAAQKGH